MFRPLVIALAALVLALPATAAEAPSPSITITGTGTVAAVPDIAVVTVGVETQAATADAAQSANAIAAAETILALRQSGVQASDIRTVSFVVTPVYADRRDNPGQPPKVTGYRVLNEVEATARDITLLGDLLDAVVASGANRIGGIRFGIGAEAVLLDDARERAVREATRRAELYARAMGVILGPIQSLVEGVPQGGYPMMAEMRTAATPIVAGTLEVSATVTMTWTIYDE